ncbi:MAG: ComF family protein, partial [Tannerella sp.]|nr:ComF family protein [Tannerella sp.]
MNSWLSSFINLFYPHLCLVCKAALIEEEDFLCLKCLCNMPKTNYHKGVNNPVRELFAGYSAINQATSFLLFERGGVTQTLVHALKYHNNKSLGEYLGRIAAMELKTCGYFASIDTIIPVPLHPKKEKKRGYNQSECIARGFSGIYGCRIDTTSVVRIADTVSQTRKNIYERHVNVEKIFTAINPESLIGKNILFIDDVITTGATTSACIDAIVDIPNIHINVFSLSIARE